MEWAFVELFKEAEESYFRPNRMFAIANALTPRKYPPARNEVTLPEGSSLTDFGSFRFLGGRRESRHRPSSASIYPVLTRVVSRSEHSACHRGICTPAYSSRQQLCRTQGVECGLEVDGHRGTHAWRLSSGLAGRRPQPKQIPDRSDPALLHCTIRNLYTVVALPR